MRVNGSIRKREERKRN